MHKKPMFTPRWRSAVESSTPNGSGRSFDFPTNRKDLNIMPIYAPNSRSTLELLVLTYAGAVCHRVIGVADGLRR